MGFQEEENPLDGLLPPTIQENLPKEYDNGRLRTILATIHCTIPEGVEEIFFQMMLIMMMMTMSLCLIWLKTMTVILSSKQIFI